MRQYSFLDKICLSFDQALRVVAGEAKTTGRPYPAKNIPEAKLTEKQRKQAAALMRINHAGEVSAQALYHGQGLASRCTELRQKMQHAALEEGDHLVWCSQRLVELGSHTSYLNALWYTGSFAIGLTAGLVGDRWSLGFLAETESQVIKHLENHLQILPVEDNKSHKILAQMRIDETHHREEAIQAGAAALPFFVKKWMSVTAKIMVKTAYWV